MVSKNKAAIEQARRLKKGAHFDLADPSGEDFLQRSKRSHVLAHLSPIEPTDHHAVAIGKHFLMVYQLKESVDLSVESPIEEIEAAWLALVDAMQRYHYAVAEWPICADTHPRHGAMGWGFDYIPSAGELDTRIPQHSKWHDNGTYKTYEELLREGVLDDAPTLREMLPDIPPGWEAIMQDRRRRYPQQYAQKKKERDVA